MSTKPPYLVTPLSVLLLVGIGTFIGRYGLLFAPLVLILLYVAGLTAFVSF